MAKKRSVNPMKLSNFFQYKASQLRSSWRERGKKYGENLDNIPSRPEIQKWLEDQSPIRCYIAGTFISNEVLEVDHKIPICRGGSFDLDNLGCTSRYYNNIKGSLTEKEFRDLLKITSKWEDKGQALFKRLMASNHIFSRGRK